MPTVWRWLDLGELAPLELHATYAGLAGSLGPGDAPILFWARPGRPHLSLGASQQASADLDLAGCGQLGVEVVQRPLGGGTVWLDREQECFFFILPQSVVQGGHQGLFDLCLAVVADWFAAAGLPVHRVGGQDLWLAGRKIMGSGAATLGRALVFGASVLRSFPARDFARCIRAPSEGFRDWLADALAEGMTDWRAQGLDPGAAELKQGLKEACRRLRGWSFVDWLPDTATREAIAEARAELSEVIDRGCGRRHVPHGIRINGLCYLLELEQGGDWLRVLLDDGIIRRVASGDPVAHGALQAVVGEPAHRGRLESRLRTGLSPQRVQTLVNRIESLCQSILQ